MSRFLIYLRPGGLQKFWCGCAVVAAAVLLLATPSLAGYGPDNEPYNEGGFSGTNSGTKAVPYEYAGYLTAGTTWTNNGTLNLDNYGNYGCDLYIKGTGTATVTGSGTIAMGNTTTGTGMGAIYIDSQVAGDTFDNEGNTISGFGVIGNNNTNFINNGMLQATGNLYLNCAGYTITNSGTDGSMQGCGGTLYFEAGDVVQGGGFISSNNGTVSFNNTTVTGGVIMGALGSGSVVINGTSNFFNGLQIQETVYQNASSTLTLGGGATGQWNNGTIAQLAASDTIWLASNQRVDASLSILGTLGGSGTIDGNVTTSAGATIVAGQGSTPGALNFTSGTGLNLTGDTFDELLGTTTGIANVTGNLTLSNTNLTIGSWSGFTDAKNTPIELMSYTGTLSGSFNQTTVTHGAYIYQVEYTPGEIYLFMPEPSIWMLFGAGLVIGAGTLRRRSC